MPVYITGLFRRLAENPEAIVDTSKYGLRVLLSVIENQIQDEFVAKF